MDRTAPPQARVTAMTASDKNACDTPELTRRLKTLRRALRRWLLVAGAARLAWFLFAVLVLDALADWLFEWERGPRVAWAVAAAVALAAAAQRWFVRPLLRLPTDARLAWEVERVHPIAAGVLVNAVEFSERSVQKAAQDRHASSRADGNRQSAALVAATCRRAEELIGKLDVTEVLDARLAQRNRRALVAGLCGLLGLATLIVVTPLGRTWFQRNVALADVPWPRSTHIRIAGVEAGRLRVARGGATVVHIEIAESSTRVPESLDVDFRPRRSQPPASLLRRSPRQFDLALRDLLDPVRFRVRGGDGRTEWIDVELLDPPWVRDVEISAWEPEYLGGREMAFPAGAGPFTVPRGSRIRVTGMATKRLESARLFRGADPLALEVVDTSRFSGQFLADTAGSHRWTLEVRDSDGLSTPRPEQFRLDVVADPPPEVRARWRGASRLVVPSGAISVEADVRDNSQVTSLAAVVRAGQTEDDSRAILAEAPIGSANKALPAPQAKLGERIELGPLGLRLGDVIEISCVAEDNDTLHGPNRGQSSGLLLRVVSPAEFRADVQRREKEQRQHLQQSLDDHAAWLAQLRESDRSPAQLLKLARRHAALKSALSGPLDVTRALGDELAHQLSTSSESAAIERLTNRVVIPLSRAHDDLGETVQRELDKARRGDPNEAVPLALAAQEQLVENVRQAIDALSGVEGFQEAVTLLEELLAAQEDVRRQTTETEQARVRAVLDKGRPGNVDDDSKQK